MYRQLRMACILYTQEDLAIVFRFYFLAAETARIGKIGDVARNRARVSTLFRTVFFFFFFLYAECMDSWTPYKRDPWGSFSPPLLAQQSLLFLISVFFPFFPLCRPICR